MERLAERAGVPRGARVLDIGCGLGGSAMWLADQFECEVTGITISPVQARMAAAKAKSRGLARRVHFQVQDANLWQPSGLTSLRPNDNAPRRADLGPLRGSATIPPSGCFSLSPEGLRSALCDPSR